jgi:8-amino-7-oxononanoate synthase
MNAEYLRNKLRVAGLNIADSTTYIIPVIIGSAADALSVSKTLYDKGFFVPAIRPPTVPAGSSRLRISVQAEHTKEQMDALAEAVKDLL